MNLIKRDRTASQTSFFMLGARFQNKEVSSEICSKTWLSRNTPTFPYPLLRMWGNKEAGTLLSNFG